jgi:hypothetical protein
MNFGRSLLAAVQLAFTASLALAPSLLFSAPEPFLGPDSPADRERLKQNAGQLSAFEPGGFFPCIDGAHINAHGGNILFEDGDYYWVGEGRAGWDSLGIHLYRSTDLYNWQFVANILPPSEEEGHDIERGCVMERPKLLRHPESGNYVLWFHLELKGQGYRAARVAVAQSPTIAGPYQFVSSFRPNGHDSRDMTVFQRADGSAYLVYASEVNLVLRAAQLTDDYLGVTERDELLFRRHREAPALFEHGGRIYMITSACTSWDANAAQLHVADSVFGPWEHLGNPAKGEGANKTFYSQPAFVFPVHGREGAFIYVGDRWRPGDLINSPHVWLPLDLPKEGHPELRWQSRWDLSVFD